MQLKLVSTQRISMLSNYYATVGRIIILVTLATIPLGESYGREGCRGSTARRLDPSSCHQYFQCIAGVSYRARCEPGTVFSPLTQKCENSARIPCTANKVTGHVLEGQRCSVNGEIRPSEIECDKYLLCRVSYYVHLRCPFPLIFSNRKYRCVTLPDECTVEIGPGGGSLKELDLKKEENPYIGICDGKINQTVPEPFDCSMYILCEEDRSNEGEVQAAMSVLECPTKTLFSSSQNKCMAPSDVYCGSRYRVVNLYGPDIPPPATMGGRSIGGRSVVAGRNPEKPKYWIQPGKYRAISAAKPNGTGTHKSAHNKTGNVTTGGGSEIITSSINGFIIQKPLQVEQPTPFEVTPADNGHGPTPATTEAEDPNLTEETTTIGFSGRNGRSFRNSVPSDRLDSNTSTKTKGGHKKEKGGIVVGGAPSTNNDEIGTMDVERTKEVIHHDPVIVNIIMNNGQQLPSVTRWYPHAQEEHHRENDTAEPHIIVRVKETLEPRKVNKSTPLTPHDKTTVVTGSDRVASMEYPTSLESDETEPFRFNRSLPRAPKRTSILEDYQAVLNGKRFNSTAEDILYYGDDDYYVGDSNETGIVLPRGANRLEDSLELTHHHSGSPPSPKGKLPERPPPLDK